MNIYTHRNETIAAAEYINSNIFTSYLGMKNNFTYYNINGIIWSVWQSGTGNYPECLGVSVNDFKI